MLQVELLRHRELLLDPSLTFSGSWLLVTSTPAAWAGCLKTNKPLWLQQSRLQLGSQQCCQLLQVGPHKQNISKVVPDLATRVRDVLKASMLRATVMVLLQ